MVPQLGGVISLSFCFLRLGFMCQLIRIIQNLKSQSQYALYAYIQCYAIQYQQINYFTMFSLIKSVFVGSNDIQPFTQKNLEKKLHHITQSLLNTNKQFDVWMELQSHDNLHAKLQQMYTRGCKDSQVSNKYPISEEQLALIYQFYMLLLKNATDQLLICKLVSDSFVIQLTKMSKLKQQLQQQLQPYRINLIKVYLGTINYEVIKYMFIQDQFKVFEQCVRIQERKSGTVQQTTINNAILNVMKKVTQLPYLCELLWVNENNLKKLLDFSLCSIKSQTSQQYMEDMEETVMFLNQLRLSFVNLEKMCIQIDNFCHKRLMQILQSITQCKSQQKQIKLISYLFCLFHVFNREQVLIEYILSQLQNIISSTTSYLEAQQLKISEQLNATLFVLGKLVLSPFSKLSNRLTNNNDLTSDDEKQLHQIKISLLQFYQSILSCLCVNNQSLETVKKISVINFLQCIFLPVFTIKMSNSSLEKTSGQLFFRIQQKVLEFFGVLVSRVRKLMENNSLWLDIIQWYENATSNVTSDLLTLPPTISSQVLKSNGESVQQMMLCLQYVRNYRFMIVNVTTLDPKAIKQQKSYHSQFNSVGSRWAPGSILEDHTNQYKTVCPCILTNNYQQIPVIIIQDKECFIIAMKNQQNQSKILINIRFKDIVNFVFGSTKNFDDKVNKSKEDPKFIRINLKGMQQINLEFNNPKLIGNIFKSYLIKSKDLCRQKQLSFLNNWLKDYATDTEKSLVILRQKYTKNDSNTQKLQQQAVVKIQQKQSGQKKEQFQIPQIQTKQQQVDTSQFL